MEIAIALVVLIVLPNVWATWRVARSGLPVHRKTIFILGAWIVPLVGANWALQAIRDGERLLDPPAAIPLPRARSEPAPVAVELPGMAPFELHDHLLDGNGAPILDFAALDAWAATAGTPEAVRAARADGHRAWLLNFRDWLGNDCQLVEAHGCWVLSPYSAGTASAAGRYMSESRKRISQLLDGVARFPEERPVLIVFSGQDDYYNYVANYYPDEGEFSFSGGMFINAGFPHFVTVRGDLDELEPVIAHEMTHFALAHLSLPLWLDEGLAVNTEYRISSARRHPAAALELLRQHHEFWTADTIQEFWTGDSFHRTDEGNALSYDLARAMVELIGRDWNAFAKFATEARREDGGAAAARAALSLELGELAAAAVNMQPTAAWNPRPEAWKHVSHKA